MSNYLEFQEIKSEYFNSDGELYGGFTGCSPVSNIIEKMNKTIDEMADEIKLLISQIEMSNYVNETGHNLKNNKHFNNLKRIVI